MSKVEIYVGNRYGMVSGPNNEKYRNEWVETPIKTTDNEVVKLVKFSSEGDDTMPAESGVVVYYENVNTLVGKLLTLVDASFHDLEQRKAFKDLTMQAAWDWYSNQRAE